MFYGSSGPKFNYTKFFNKYCTKFFTKIKVVKFIDVIVEIPISLQTSICINYFQQIFKINYLKLKKYKIVSIPPSYQMSNFFRTFLHYFPFSVLISSLSTGGAGGIQVFRAVLWAADISWYCNSSFRYISGLLLPRALITAPTSIASFILTPLHVLPLK